MVRNAGFFVSVISLIFVVMISQHCSVFRNEQGTDLASAACATDERMMHINGKQKCVRLSCINSQGEVTCNEYLFEQPDGEEGEAEIL